MKEIHQERQDGRNLELIEEAATLVRRTTARMSHGDRRFLTEGIPIFPVPLEMRAVFLGRKIIAWHGRIEKI